VVTVFIGPYLASVAKAAADANGQIAPFGITMHPGAWFSYAVSASVLLQVVVLPIVGALTDRTTLKRRMLGTLAFIGAFATTLLYFVTVDAGNYLMGGVLFVIANLAFGASMVVANAFLPVLASPQERDKVSSRGWALGYLGGGLLLLVHLLYFNHIDSIGGAVGDAVRVILSSAGVWWALFTLAPLTMLPKRVETPYSEEGPPNIARSFTQLWQTLKSLRAYPMTLLFFVAYLLYNDAVQTVISMASVYGQEELHLELDVLTKAILIVQFVAVGGSLIFERLAAVITTKRAIVVGLIGWAGVMIAAYAVVASEMHFYVLAVVIAIVMGGTQALSRSLFSQMIPRGKEAEYFALYEISDKGTSWLGPLFFGLALTYTSSYRAAVLSLIIFLVAGLLLLFRVNVDKAIADTHRGSQGQES
jgi:UMF1 family MFS transporter